jgi:NAD+ kinase
MKRIGIIAKIGNPDAVRLSCDVAEWLGAKGVEVFADTSLAKCVGHLNFVRDEDLPEKVDGVVVLGGDGTMLHAARLLKGAKIPILGANMGGLGFLTAIKIEEIFGTLETMISGKFETEERMMLDVELIRGGKIIESRMVLNDMAIKNTTARLCVMDTSINNEFVTSYRADGIIVATPTGSTGYSLSAQGPILYPTIHSIIVVPICPFNLTNRPMVVPDWMDVEIRLKSKNAKVELTLDGQFDVDMQTDDVVKVKRAEKSVYLVKCAGKGYFEILRERLSWEVSGDR